MFYTNAFNPFIKTLLNCQKHNYIWNSSNMNNWNVLILNTFEFKIVIFVDNNVPQIWD